MALRQGGDVGIAISVLGKLEIVFSHVQPGIVAHRADGLGLPQLDHGVLAAGGEFAEGFDPLQIPEAKKSHCRVNCGQYRRAKRIPPRPAPLIRRKVDFLPQRRKILIENQQQKRDQRDGKHIGQFVH